MNTTQLKGRIVLMVVYLVALAAGAWIGISQAGTGLLISSAIAVAVTVLVIFTGSVLFNNSSVFDPYWSVAPPLMVLYYLQGLPDYGDWRINLVFLLTLIYGIRLTWNFLRGWPGLIHEDWRYANFRKSTGKAYWLVSFSAIHLFPATMVFLGTLSVWVAVTQDTQGFNAIDIAAVVVTAAAILLETIADRQLRNFVRTNNEAGKVLDRGLWAWSRHPNYLGEILFWWGLYLFALAANPAFWWVIAGPLAITVMFIFASIPMIEKRHLERRKNYAGYMERVSMLIPFKF